MYEPNTGHHSDAPLRVTIAPEPPRRDPDRLGPAPLHVDDILRRVVELGGSDLHLAAGCHPVIRLRGEMAPLTEYPVLDGKGIREMMYAVITQKQRERFEDELELDTSHSIPGVGRFRVNVLVQRDAVGAVMRVIP
ncbi:MAG: type IV pili twitching motility protein PilT, partial [Actinobacteria bacterium]|nr:type IV pili twitching motility protein PilT [Actinomycetota bacterium]